MDLLVALGDLRSGSTLAVHHDGDRVTVYDPSGDRILLVADSVGLASAGPGNSPAPGDNGTAYVREVKDPDGRLLYSHGRTARGAQVMIVAPGQVNETGLHVLSFDNDDVDIRDGFGRLIYRRHTGAEGTLTEQIGPAYGCGCERQIHPDGMLTRRML